MLEGTTYPQSVKNEFYIIVLNLRHCTPCIHIPKRPRCARNSEYFHPLSVLVLTSCYFSIFLIYFCALLSSLYLNLSCQGIMEFDFSQNSRIQGLFFGSYKHPFPKTCENKDRIHVMKEIDNGCPSSLIERVQRCKPSKIWMKQNANARGFHMIFTRSFWPWQKEERL